MSNAHYWNRKEELSTKANQHTIDMRDNYKNEIEQCIQNSIIWSADDELNNITFEQFDVTKNADLSEINSLTDIGNASFSIIKDTTDGALMSSFEEPIAVLNFASYKNPGGGFLKGSSAQEESLCHASYLYNILRELVSYYDWNNEHLNKGIYTNRAIYTYNVRFFDADGTSKVADVITCAAPNRSLLERYSAFTEEENAKALESRAKFLSIITQLSNPNLESVILGAWGCGVFRQNPNTVCTLLSQSFIHSNLKEIKFAIPDDKTYNVFLNTFNGNK